MNHILTRLPRPNVRCPHTGLNRGTLYRWITPTAENNYNPPVKLYVVKRNARSKKGIRWIDVESLIAHIKNASLGVQGVSNAI